MCYFSSQQTSPSSLNFFLLWNKSNFLSNCQFYFRQTVPAWQKFSNDCPSVTINFMQIEHIFLLFLTPDFLFDSRIEMIMPPSFKVKVPFPTLLARSLRSTKLLSELVRNMSPVLIPIFPNEFLNNPVLIFRPHSSG